MDAYYQYITNSGMHRFGFLLREGAEGYQVQVMDGPSFPEERVAPDQVPPGCKREGGGFWLRWCDMAELTEPESTLQLAGFWAEQIEEFIATGVWKVFYSTNDGVDEFCFSIKKIGRRFRVYIDQGMDYGNRGSGSHATHRLTDGHGKYVCWNKEIPDWENAEDVASLWAESTQNYIRTGKRF